MSTLVTLSVGAASEQQRPNTSENQASSGTRRRSQALRLTTPDGLQNLHPRFKSGRRLHFPQNFRVFWREPALACHCLLLRKVLELLLTPKSDFCTSTASRRVVGVQSRTGRRFAGPPPQPTRHLRRPSCVSVNSSTIKLATLVVHAGVGRPTGTLTLLDVTRGDDDRVTLGVSSRNGSWGCTTLLFETTLPEGEGKTRSALRVAASKKATPRSVTQDGSVFRFSHSPSAPKSTTPGCCAGVGGDRHRPAASPHEHWEPVGRLQPAASSGSAPHRHRPPRSEEASRPRASRFRRTCLSPRHS